MNLSSAKDSDYRAKTGSQLEVKNFYFKQHYERIVWADYFFVKHSSDKKNQPFSLLEVSEKAG